jgi:hypothetical protein
MKTPLSYTDLQVEIAKLDFRDPHCMCQVAEARLLLEDAYAARSITLRQWRELWEDVSIIQARCAVIQPDAWRRPVLAESKVTYVPPPPVLTLR